MKKIDIALLIGVIAAVLFSAASVVNKNVESISDKVLRLHILANSDSDEDQALKLKVRDAVLAESGIFLNGDYSRLEAESLVLENTDKIQSIAQRVVSENGYNYSVSVQLVNMTFDQRVYDSITLPAGDYDALRITIGSAEGKNWWCVMYPQFCIAPSLSKEELEFFNDSELQLMTTPKKYKFRFKLLELLQSVL